MKTVMVVIKIIHLKEVSQAASWSHFMKQTGVAARGEYFKQRTDEDKLAGWQSKVQRMWNLLVSADCWSVKDGVMIVMQVHNDGDIYRKDSPMITFCIISQSKGQ